MQAANVENRGAKLVINANKAGEATFTVPANINAGVQIQHRLVITDEGKIVSMRAQCHAAAQCCAGLSSWRAVPTTSSAAPSAAVAGLLKSIAPKPAGDTFIGYSIDGAGGRYNILIGPGFRP